MTSPDQVARIKKVLMDTEKLCGNCRYNGVSDCNRPGGLCELFDGVPLTLMHYDRSADVYVAQELCTGGEMQEAGIYGAD